MELKSVVPDKPVWRKSGFVQTHLPSPYFELLSREAARSGLPKIEVIRRIIKQYFDNKPEIKQGE